MIEAAQTAGFETSVAEIHAAMRATALDQRRLTVGVPEEYEISLITRTGIGVSRSSSAESATGCQ